MAGTTHSNAFAQSNGSVSPNGSRNGSPKQLNYKEIKESQANRGALSKFSAIKRNDIREMRVSQYF
jgi:hypothetical protein